MRGIAGGNGLQLGGIPANGGLVTEIPRKDVINSALGLAVIWPELQVPGF